MKTHDYYIKRMPSLNEYIDKCRRNKFAGADMKKKWQQDAVKVFVEAGVSFEKPVSVNFHFFEPEKGHKRDLDNISGFAHKVILDAMKEAGVIKDDKPDYVFSITDFYTYVPYEPNIMVSVTERAD